MYVSIYLCKYYTNMYVCIDVCGYISLYIICLHVCRYISLILNLHCSRYISWHVCMWILMQKCSYRPKWSKNHKHINTYTYTYTLHVHIHIRMYITYAYTHTHVQYICIYTYTYICHRHIPHTHTQQITHKLSTIWEQCRRVPGSRYFYSGIPVFLFRDPGILFPGSLYSGTLFRDLSIRELCSGIHKLSNHSKTMSKNTGIPVPSRILVFWLVPGSRYSG